jgi:hypothetical protein
VHTSLAVEMLATHIACKQNKLPGMIGVEKELKTGVIHTWEPE